MAAAASTPPLDAESKSAEPAAASPTQRAFSVYIVRCADGTLYTGVAVDVARRVSEHNAGRKGARYTAARRPVTLVLQVEVGSRSDALKEEARIKRLSRAEKDALIRAATASES